MINYSLKYGVSEVARIFEVDRDTVKSLAYHFSEYLNSEANPEKGISRQFSIEDIRVLAYVFLYWEDEPDFENIRYGLNSNSHWGNELIDNTIQSVIPIFREMPENIDESWRGIVFGGEFELSTLFETAQSFKLAGDKLVAIAHKNYEERELFLPAIYNYRHATELYIKAVSRGNKIHDLNALKQRLTRTLKENFNAVMPTWFSNIIDAFHYADPSGSTFRYAESLPNQELYMDLNHVKTLMNWMAESFEIIRRETESR